MPSLLLGSIRGVIL